MKPLLVSSIPYTRPDGAKTFSSHMSRIMDTPLYVPRWDDVEITFSSMEPAGVTEEVDGDYTFLCGPYSNKYLDEDPSRIDWVKSLPKPLLYFAHDGENLSERYSRFWSELGDEIDFFLVSRYSIGNRLTEMGKKWAHVEYPYVFGHSMPYWKSKEDRIISAGRLVPEKGHRMVASLCRYGYKVSVVGSSGAGEPMFEQKLYLDSLGESGADVLADVGMETMKKEASFSKIYMTLGFWPEQEGPIEYTAFECMSVGCIPIVGKIFERHYRESGLRFFSVESYVEAMPIIDMIFRESGLASEMSCHNYGILKKWCSYLPGMIEDIVMSIKRGR